MKEVIYWKDNWELAIIDQKDDKVIAVLPLPNPAKMSDDDSIIITIPRKGGKIILGEISNA